MCTTFIQCPQRLKEGDGSPGTGVPGGGEQPCGCWEPSHLSSPLRALYILMQNIHLPRVSVIDLGGLELLVPGAFLGSPRPDHCIFLQGSGGYEFSCLA